MRDNIENLAVEEEVADIKPKIPDVISEIGLELDKVAMRIRERLELLNNRTKTIEDGLKSVRTARSLFEYYEAESKNRAFSEMEKRVIVIGSIFSDIGKTGPADATLEQQNLVTDMFAVENVKNPKMSVREFFQMYFSDTAEDRLQTFEQMGLNPEMTMREFWNLHSLWTLHIISGDGVPLEAIAGAAIHHIMEGVNPDHILGMDNRFIQYFGENKYFDRAEKLIIILDQYDAFTRRGKKTIEEALTAVREKISNHPIFSKDDAFNTLLHDLQIVLSKKNNI